MGKVYKGQTKLKLSVNVGTDISGGTATLRYIKPTGEKGEFPAVITSGATGDIEYVPVSSSDFDVIGCWIIWGYVVFSDARVAAGEPFQLVIHKEGT